MDQQNLTQNVDTLFANMENFTQKEGLIGKAVVNGDKTFLPVVSISIGYGGGDTQAKNQMGTNPTSTSGMGNMIGGALGLGAKLTTEAVIVIDKDTVSLAPIGASGNMSQMIDKIPEIVSNMNTKGQQNNQQQKQ